MNGSTVAKAEKPASAPERITRTIARLRDKASATDQMLFAIRDSLCGPAESDTAPPSDGSGSGFFANAEDSLAELERTIEAMNHHADFLQSAVGAG